MGRGGEGRGGNNDAHITYTIVEESPRSSERARSLEICDRTIERTNERSSRTCLLRRRKERKEEETPRKRKKMMDNDIKFVFESPCRALRLTSILR